MFYNQDTLDATLRERGFHPTVITEDGKLANFPDDAVAAEIAAIVLAAQVEDDTLIISRGAAIRLKALNWEKLYQYSGDDLSKQVLTLVYLTRAEEGKIHEYMLLNVQLAALSIMIEQAARRVFPLLPSPKGLATWLGYQAKLMSAAMMESGDVLKTATDRVLDVAVAIGEYVAYRGEDKTKDRARLQAVIDALNKTLTPTAYDAEYVEYWLHKKPKLDPVEVIFQVLAPIPGAALAGLAE